MSTEDLLFHKEHSWVRVANSTAVVGISDYAQDMLGDIVYLDIPDAGEMVSAGDVIGEIESVKSTSDLYAPVSGEIIATNEKPVDTPEVINGDPYGDGWMYKVELSDSTELDALMSEAEYAVYVKGL
ncbi:MAG: glycine cleavage system protein GcvH [Actinomycetota bacterium]|nr:glycine cleavage system protein GcvH [Actinomycetota bacterium]